MSLSLFAEEKAQPQAPAEPTLTNIWSTTIGVVFDSSPAVAEDGTIYFGSFDGRFWAMNGDGNPKWVFRAGREIRSSPAIGEDQKIYFGSRDRKIYALKPDGTKAWEVGTGAWVDSSPAITSGGLICVGSWDGNFYALESGNGTLRWSFKTGGPIVSSPAIGRDGTIYFGSHDGMVYAIASDGSKRWAFNTGAAVLSSPALNGSDNLYITSVNGWLYSLKMDGTVAWKLHTAGVTGSSPVIGQHGTVYVGANTNMWVVTSEGKTMWTYATHDVLENSATAFSDGSFCLISRSGLLLCLTEKRELAWKLYVYGQGDASPGVGPKNVLYLQSFISGTDFAAVQGTHPLATSTWPKFRGDPRNTGRLGQAR